MTFPSAIFDHDFSSYVTHFFETGDTDLRNLQQTSNMRLSEKISKDMIQFLVCMP